MWVQLAIKSLIQNSCFQNLTNEKHCFLSAIIVQNIDRMHHKWSLFSKCCGAGHDPPTSCPPLHEFIEPRLTLSFYYRVLLDIEIGKIPLKHISLKPIGTTTGVESFPHSNIKPCLDQLLVLLIWFLIQPCVNVTSYKTNIVSQTSNVTIR